MASGENPRAALAALLPEPVPVEGTGEVVRPFTLALFAALDRIRSPLLHGDAARTDAFSLLPSLFLVCKGASEGLKPELLRRAVEWADTLPPTALSSIQNAAAKQIEVFFSVVPESKKKAGEGLTDGS